MIDGRASNEVEGEPRGGSRTMVDIHSHVLPGIDDGAPDVDVSIEMLRQAAAGGTSDLVATPHQDPGRYPNEPEAIHAAHAVLAEAVQRIRATGEDLPRLHLGAEVHLEAELVERIAAGRRLRLAGGPYLLLELSDVFPLRGVEDLVYRLRLAGTLPVLAHPERVGQLLRRPEQVRRLVEMGALTQVTANSVTGAFGEPCRKVTEELLREGLVHVVASDAHDLRRRTTSLALARADVDAMLGPEQGRLLFEDHPRAVLHGADLAPRPPVTPTPTSPGMARRLAGWLRR